jgi:hypothetical protein
MFFCQKKTLGQRDSSRKVRHAVKRLPPQYPSFHEKTPSRASTPPFSKRARLAAKAVATSSGCVTAALCGVTVTLGCSHSAEAAGKGSVENTSATM